MFGLFKKKPFEYSDLKAAGKSRIQSIIDGNTDNPLICVISESEFLLDELVSDTEKVALAISLLKTREDQALAVRQMTVTALERYHNNSQIISEHREYEYREKAAEELLPSDSIPNELNDLTKLDIAAILAAKAYFNCAVGKAFALITEEDNSVNNWYEAIDFAAHGRAEFLVDAISGYSELTAVTAASIDVEDNYNKLRAKVLGG